MFLPPRVPKETREGGGRGVAVDMFAAVMFLFGLVAGSFLNVCISRLPQGESIVLPGSHCPACGHRLAAWDLVPVLSFLFLKGCCRYCRAGISPRYPAIELLTGLGFYAVAYYSGLTLETALGLILLSGLIVCSLTDYDRQIIPDKIILFLILAGAPLLGLQSVDALLRGLLGLLVTGLVMLALGLLFRGKLGGGDVKLAAAIGLYLGWQSSLLALWLASLLALLVLLAGRCLRKETPRRISFGPFLAAGAMIAWFYGADLLRLVFGKA